MNPGYLVLYPAAPDHAAQPEPLLESLQALGLIGEREGRAPERYRTGNAYLKLVTYLGCSPSIPLADGPAGTHCHLRLAGPYPAPALLSGSNTRPPRCPRCNHAFSDWREWLSGDGENPTSCGQCGEALHLQRLRWREQAAVARLFLLISHVFPGEAVPGERLMRSINRGGIDWRYAYVQNPGIWHPGTGWEAFRER